MNETASKAGPLDATQLLTFVVGEDEYGLPIRAVKEILQATDLSQMPRLSPVFRGVADLRGSPLPVVDLRAHFGLDEAEVSRFACIVAVEVRAEGEERTIGLLVDAVREVMESSPRQRREAPSFGRRIRCELLSGLIETGERFVQLIDLQRLLSPSELSGIAGALASSGEAPGGGSKESRT